MLLLCVNVYCHRVTTQLQLINIIIIIKRIAYVRYYILKTEPFFKLQISTLQSRSKNLGFVFRQRKLFNEGGEFLLIK